MVKEILLRLIKAGLDLTGMVRDIALIKEKEGNCLLFLRNNDYPVLFKLKKPKAFGKAD
jgi:hypothetical protein